LLVKLPKTDVVILTGDAARFSDNFAHRRVPSMNYNADQTVASLMAPEFYE
jgi:hypothetical protein